MLGPSQHAATSEGVFFTCDIQFPKFPGGELELGLTQSSRPFLNDASFVMIKSQQVATVPDPVICWPGAVPILAPPYSVVESKQAQAVELLRSSKHG